MSAFGNYEKDYISESIINFIRYKIEKKQDIQINELVKEVMEAVNYGLEVSIWEIENS